MSGLQTGYTTEQTIVGLFECRPTGCTRLICKPRTLRVSTY